ncbi:hypothetical protein G7Y89_g3857 [Cudoniella acicularis]|uniref:LysM domain-containing protein n=1 Tax=Cudoniella acicularis TaxID=354080 RepID=A0A8H4RTJ5_9HELO|nr:hypothetical protein G7Y89_g3857 [Cudoniella acicularis]
MAGHGVDINYWYKENITSLCTSTCQSSLESWKGKVSSACAKDTIVQSGVEVQAKAMVFQITYNFDLACLQDSKNNWCLFESQNWVGSNYIRWEPTMCFETNSTVPQCNDPTFDISHISDDMSSITNLYNKTLYCDECYLKLFRQRMLDPWLPKSNFTDYLVTQFGSLQSACSTSLPYTTSASTLFLGTPTTTAKATTTSAFMMTTCTGQTLKPLNQPLTCNELSDQFNITTGDARVATSDYYCQFNRTICVPLPCQLDILWEYPSCKELAAKYSSKSYVVTEAQFLSWNPNIQGSCDGLAAGQRICQQAPGGTYPPPVASLYAPTGTSAYYTTAQPAAPTQSGTIPDCGRYYLVMAGDSCNGVALQAGINFTQLQSFNTYLNNACTNLWLSYDVCIAKVTPPSVSKDGTCGPGMKFLTLLSLIPLLVPIIPPNPHLACDYSIMDEMPDIDRWLVTPDNPPRDVQGMDHERCAALHNYIIQYAWISSNRQLSEFPKQSWLDKYDESTGTGFAHQFDPTLAMFLQNAYHHDYTELSFFYWTSILNSPEYMWKTWPSFDEADEYRYLTLYRANEGSHSDGLCYDQKRHKAVVFMSIDDRDFAKGEDGEQLWFPLETILSNWISMMRMGKITAGPEGVQLKNEKYFPWVYHSYSYKQVEDTVAAFNQLVVAIESHLPANSQATKPSTVISDRLLDFAGVKEPSFARSFLQCIRLPGFRYLAPGILIPSVDAFAQSQLFTSIQDPNDDHAVPPVLLFPTVEKVQFDLQDQYGARNPFRPVYVDALKHINIPAGIYSDAISRVETDNAEEGFTFVLPYTIGENKFARKSDGSQLGEGNFKDLYQHGFKPFGGDWSRAVLCSYKLDIVIVQWDISHINCVRVLEMSAAGWTHGVSTGALHHMDAAVSGGGNAAV